MTWLVLVEIACALALGVTTEASFASDDSGGHPEDRTQTLSTDVLATYQKSTYPWELPAWMPKPLDPRDNPTTPARVPRPTPAYAPSLLERPPAA